MTLPGDDKTGYLLWVELKEECLGVPGGSVFYREPSSLLEDHREEHGLCLGNPQTDQMNLNKQMQLYCKQ